MANGQDAYKTTSLVELVDHPVRPHPKRSQSAETAAQRLACFGVSFQETQCFIHCPGERPAEVEHFLSGSADELDPGHLPLAALLEVSTEFGERHGLSSFGLPEALFDGVHGLGIGKNLRRLLQRLVLVHRYEHGGGPTPPGDDEVLSQVGHLIDHLAQLATKLPNRNSLAHGHKCTVLSTHLPVVLPC